MSTDPGGKAVASDLLAQSKALVESATVAEREQMDWLDPLTPEELAAAREELGSGAGGLSVLRQARENRRGRPPGSRNRRSDDFAKYIGQFGQDPAITLMQIQSTPTEVLIERSRQNKVHSFRPDGTPNMVVERMSYSDAEALRVRCAEALMPFIHSKRPVAIDMSFSGVADLFIEGVTHTAEEMADIVEAEFLPIDDEPEGGE